MMTSENSSLFHSVVNENECVPSYVIGCVTGNSLSGLSGTGGLTGLLSSLLISPPRKVVCLYDKQYNCTNLVKPYPLLSLIRKKASYYFFMPGMKK